MFGSILTNKMKINLTDVHYRVGLQLDVRHYLFPQPHWAICRANFFVGFGQGLDARDLVSDESIRH
jgi:hypothetical protein